MILNASKRVESMQSKFKTKLTMIQEANKRLKVSQLAMLNSLRKNTLLNGPMELGVKLREVVKVKTVRRNLKEDGEVKEARIGKLERIAANLKTLLRDMLTKTSCISTTSRDRMKVLNIKKKIETGWAD